MEQSAEWRLTSSNRRSSGRQFTVLVSTQTRSSLSAAALARAALGAHATGTGPDNFFTAAMRAGNIHKHIPERCFYPVGMGITIRQHPRVPFRWRMVGNDIDQFLLGRSRQIGHRSVDRLLFHLRNLLERQLRLSTVRRSRLLVTFDKLASEPAKNVIRDAGGAANIRIFCEPARFEPLVGKFFDETLERHAILKRNGGECADRVHQPANR